MSNSKAAKAPVLLALADARLSARLSSWIRAGGRSCRRAASLEAALARAHSGVELIVIEAGFGGLDELGALRRLRSVSAAPAAIVADGDDGASLRAEAFLLGAHGVLSRPFDRENFLALALPKHRR